MKLAKMRVAVGAIISSMLLSMLALPAHALGNGIVLADGHTDAFYIDSEGGQLSVQVNHGLNNEKYDPNNVQFSISPETYGDYSEEMPYLSRGTTGYYTNNLEATTYFEPGWSAPGYQNNGFKSVRIDFSAVQGPGAVAILGNSLSEDTPLGAFLIPTNKLATLKDFITKLEDPQTAKATRENYAIQGIPGGTHYLDAGVTLPIFGHQHAHWFFTAAGEYQITGKAVGEKLDGSFVESEPFTSTFVINKFYKDGALADDSDPVSEDAESDQSATSSEDDEDDATAVDEEDDDSDDVDADDDEDEDDDADIEDTQSPSTPQSSDSGILTAPITLDTGHTDGFFVLTKGDKPRLVVRENATSFEGTLRTPESVTFHLEKRFYEKIGTMNDTFAEGAGYHTNRKLRGLNPFSPGWSVDNFASHGYSDVAVKFLSVKGPGQLILSGTPKIDSSLNPVLSTNSPYLTAGAKLPITGHTHGLWIFTAPGDYYYTAQVVATKTTGETITSDPVRYHWVIDPNDEDPQNNNNPIDSTISHDEEIADTEDAEDSYEDADITITSPKNAVQPGQTLTVKGSNLPPSKKVSFVISSFGKTKTTAVVSGLSTDQKGNITAKVTLPNNLQPGRYLLGITLEGQDSQLDNEQFTVVAKDTTPILPGQDLKPGGTDQPAAPAPNASLNNIVNSHEKVILDHGHLDLFTVIQRDGQLHLVTKDDSTNEEIIRDPADIQLRVRNNALTSMPDKLDNSIPKYGYYLDASGSSQQELLFPGWDTYRVAPTFESTDIIIKKVTGPGKVYLFNYKRMGGVEPAFTSEKYLMEDGSTIRQDQPSHVHTNWLFTQPGLYTMEVQAKATPVSGGAPVLSNVATFRWMVGDTAVLPQDDNSSSSDVPSKPTPQEQGPRVILASGKFTATENEKITIQATGIVPGTKVDFYLHSTPQLLAGDVLVDMHGVAQASVTTPKLAGLHTIVATAKDGRSLAVMPFEITPEYPQGVIPDAGALKPLDKENPNKKRIEISNGHIDLFTVLAHNGNISIKAKDDSHGKVTHHDPADVYWRVSDKALTDIPQSMPQEISRRGYYLDQSGNNQGTILFPGWDTNGVKPAFGTTDIIFTKVKGPKDGKVFLFSNGRTGGVVPTLTSQHYELTDGAMIRQEKPAHVHTNWLFSAPGIYEMEVKAVATPVNGGAKVESQPVTYTWLVGDKTLAPGQNNAKDQQDPPADQNNHSSADTDTSGTNGSDAGNTNDSAASGTGTSTATADPHQDVPVAKCFPKQQGGNGKDTIIPQIKDDRSAPGKWIDPSSAAFAIGAAGKATTNQAIGSIPSGTPVWMISATQTANVPWVGANTQNPSFLDKTKGSATFTLSSFSGPGKMEVYTSGNFGQVVGQKWFTGSGSSASGSVSLKPNSHVHPNWVFDKPGTYKVGITMSAQGKDGKEMSGTTTLTFNVGSGSGITDGHFDLGPTVGAAGSKTVWLDANGNPCTPDATDLAAAGLATTGVEGTMPFSLISLVLMLSGISALVYRRKHYLR